MKLKKDIFKFSDDSHCEYYIFNGQDHGHYVQFYAGNKHSEGQYKRNQQFGIWKRYHDDGKMWWIDIRIGVRSGITINFH